MTSSQPDRQPQAEVQTEFDALAFRRTMGHLATGITVITTETPVGTHGMTANAVTSLSLSPPLMLVCVDRQAHTAEHIRAVDRFGINILSDTQEPLSRLFSGSWREPNPPEHHFEPWAGVQYLAGSLGALSCRVTEILDGGDHIIVIGRVVGLRVDEPGGNPLLYYRGRYVGLAQQDNQVAGEQPGPPHPRFNVCDRNWKQDDDDDADHAAACGT